MTMMKPEEKMARAFEQPQSEEESGHKDDEAGPTSRALRLPNATSREAHMGPATASSKGADRKRTAEEAEIEISDEEEDPTKEGEEKGKDTEEAEASNSEEDEEEEDCSDEYVLDQNRFPDKVRFLLNERVAPNAIWWLPEGDAVAVNKNAFSMELLIRHFRGNKFSSVTRNFNRWGFRRVPDDRVPSGVLGYSHDMFQREKVHLLRKMKKEVYIKKEKDPNKEETNSTGGDEEEDHQGGGGKPSPKRKKQKISNFHKAWNSSSSKSPAADRSPSTYLPASRRRASATSNPSQTSSILLDGLLASASASSPSFPRGPAATILAGMEAGRLATGSPAMKSQGTLSRPSSRGNLLPQAQVSNGSPLLNAAPNASILHSTVTRGPAATARSALESLAVRRMLEERNQAEQERLALMNMSSAAASVTGIPPSYQASLAMQAATAAQQQRHRQEQALQLALGAASNSRASELQGTALASILQGVAGVGAGAAPSPAAATLLQEHLRQEQLRQLQASGTTNHHTMMAMSAAAAEAAIANRMGGSHNSLSYLEQARQEGLQSLQIRSELEQQAALMQLQERTAAASGRRSSGSAVADPSTSSLAAMTAAQRMQLELDLQEQDRTAIDLMMRRARGML